LTSNCQLPAQLELAMNDSVSELGSPMGRAMPSMSFASMSEVGSGRGSRTQSRVSILGAVTVDPGPKLKPFVAVGAGHHAEVGRSRWQCVA
jgi:hypothetical protein